MSRFRDVFEYTVEKDEGILTSVEQKKKDAQHKRHRHIYVNLDNEKLCLWFV